MEISNGGDVSRIYGEMMEGAYTGDVATTRTNLLKYCKLDTLAMVQILRKLRESVLA